MRILLPPKLTAAVLLLFFVSSFVTSEAQAVWDLECYIKNNCNRGGSSSPSANPSSGSQVKINPSAVPTEAGFGIEGLFFRDEVDVAIVRGTGRVGAALSPSNSEETFFGPPGFELDQKLLERKITAQKYPNQKITLAGALSLLDKTGSGLKSYSLKLGAMGKYNKLTKDVSPGLGLNGTLGFVSFGGSIYADETLIQDPVIEGGPQQSRLKYLVQTYNLGIFLNSIIVDYSHLNLHENETKNESNVTLLTVSLMLKKFIVTLAQRKEVSGRLQYNYETRTLEKTEEKYEGFGGVQYMVNKNLMIGGFYNYYLLSEGSLALTLFF